jgi:hypothetical protein
MVRLAAAAAGHRAAARRRLHCRPATGFLDPAADFGSIYRPMVSIAVAIILFEGGLTLNFKEIRETSKAVRRIIMYGGPMVWGMGRLPPITSAG